MPHPTPQGGSKYLATKNKNKCVLPIVDYLAAIDVHADSRHETGTGTEAARLRRVVTVCCVMRSKICPPFLMRVVR